MASNHVDELQQKISKTLPAGSKINLYHRQVMMDGEVRGAISYEMRHNAKLYCDSFDFENAVPPTETLLLVEKQIQKVLGFMVVDKPKTLA